MLDFPLFFVIIIKCHVSSLNFFFSFTNLLLTSNVPLNGVTCFKTCPYTILTFLRNHPG